MEPSVRARRLATIFLAFAICGYIACFERHDMTVALVTTVSTVVLFSLCLAVTRRVFFSTALTAVVIALIVIASKLKFQQMFVTLSAYDIYMYLLAPGVVSYVAHEFPMLFAIGLCALSMALTLLVWSYRADTPGTLGRLAFVICAVSLASLTFIHTKDGRVETEESFHRYFMYRDSSHLFSFYRSVLPAVNALLGDGVMRAAAVGTGAPFVGGTSCSAQAELPHIILVHDESAAPPSIYPAIKHDPKLDNYFKSFDGKTHFMQTEVFGAGSHLTIFSVLAGLSARYFGEFAYMVTDVTDHRIADTLPDVLKACGYQTSLFYPFLKTFGRDVKLYETVTFDQSFYLNDLGFKSYKMRDKAYYEKVLDFVENQTRDATAPQFVFMQTMNLHPPYANSAITGGALGATAGANAPEVDAYLANLALSLDDYTAFKAELERRMPGKPFLIVRYGDHQPQAYRSLILGRAPVAPVISSLIPDHSTNTNLSPKRRQDLTYNDRPERIAYYAVDTVNYDAPPLPSFDLLHVAYLSTAVLMASGIELPDTYQARLDLMERCAGRYYTCPDDTGILAFHRRLMDSALIGQVRQPNSVRPAVVASAPKIRQSRTYQATQLVD